MFGYRERTRKVPVSWVVPWLPACYAIHATQTSQNFSLFLYPQSVVRSFPASLLHIHHVSLHPLMPSILNFNKFHLSYAYCRNIWIVCWVHFGKQCRRKVLFYIESYFADWFHCNGRICKNEFILLHWMLGERVLAWRRLITSTGCTFEILVKS